MTAVMQGVRILEVAEHTFVPAASALLADWGADVVKIEHVERGDAMRGLASTGIAVMGTTVHVLLEHSNRGKRSLALDLTSDEGLAILYQLAGTADVFLTNKLPHVRTKLKIDVDDIRAHNPDIIYVRGTGQGERGPDADKGSYDSLAYWCRAGVAMGMKHEEYDYVPMPPAPAFGDSIGAMTVAGGIMGALFHRERTGAATTVDVSLLGVGLWSMGAALALSLQHERGWAPLPLGAATGNPLVATYGTSDGHYISLGCLQAAKYWPEFCAVIERPELAIDERFAGPAISAHAAEATDLVRGAFAEHTVDEWRGATGGLQRAVGRGAGHPRGRVRSADGRERVRRGLRDCGRHAVPPRRGAGPVRREARGSQPRAGVQRARRRDPRGARLRHGHDPGPEGARRRQLNGRCDGSAAAARPASRRSPAASPRSRASSSTRPTT